MKRCVKYWIKILKMPENTLIKKYCNMMKYCDELGHTNWVTEVKKLLQKNGFGYIWDMQVVNNELGLILAFVQRLKDQFIQKWTTEVNSNRKLIF